MNAHWTLRVEANGKWEETEGYMNDFENMIGNGLAHVGMSTTFGLDYSTVKVHASVTITCNQDEATINKAGELAFFKSMELAKDALTHAIPEKDKTLRELYGGG